MSRDGKLGSTEQSRKMREEREKAFRLIRDDITALHRMPEFNRWLGRLLQRCGLTDSFETESGSRIFRLEGRRDIAVEVLAEIEEIEPGAYFRVLKARQEFEMMIRAKDEPSPEGEDDGDADE